MLLQINWAARWVFLNLHLLHVLLLVVIELQVVMLRDVSEAVGVVCLTLHLLHVLLLVVMLLHINGVVRIACLLYLHLLVAKVDAVVLRVSNPWCSCCSGSSNSCHCFCKFLAYLVWQL
jgi:hypothetical protein